MPPPGWNPQGSRDAVCISGHLFVDQCKRGRREYFDHYVNGLCLAGGSPDTDGKRDQRRVGESPSQRAHIIRAENEVQKVSELHPVLAADVAYTLSMKFARYWTRRESQATDSSGQSIQVSSRGWSDVSLLNAAALAEERARRLAQRLATDRPAGNLYDYGDSPVPEPIVHDFRPEGAAAVVTRNSYGSLVLNTDDLLFADV